MCIRDRGIIQEAVRLAVTSANCHFNSYLNRAATFITEEDGGFPPSPDFIFDEELVNKKFIKFDVNEVHISSLALLVIANQISDTPNITMGKIHSTIPRVFPDIKLKDNKRTKFTLDENQHPAWFKLLGEKCQGNKYWLKFRISDFFDFEVFNKNFIDKLEQNKGGNINVY